MPRTLYHYTTGRGLAGILQDEAIYPSTSAKNSRDIRFGEGVYLSDIVPGTRTGAQLSRALIGHPFSRTRFDHFLELDVSGLEIILGRPGVYVRPGADSLDIRGRILDHGPVSHDHAL